MKFAITYTDYIEKKEVVYYKSEWSFDTIPAINNTNFDIALNYLNLTVVGSDNRIAQIWGFGGGREWVKSKISPPNSRKGILTVVSRLSEKDYGISHRLLDNIPITINTQTNWICYGDYQQRANAVEFLYNCIAVLNSENELVALWISPRNI